MVQAVPLMNNKIGSEIEIPAFTSVMRRPSRWKDVMQYLINLQSIYSLFMCQDEHENEDEHESFGWFCCIFNIKGDERTSTSSLLRLRTNEPYIRLWFFVFVKHCFIQLPEANEKMRNKTHMRANALP